MMVAIMLIVCLIVMDRTFLHTGLNEWVICLITIGYLLLLDKPVRRSLDKFFKVKSDQ